jgi:hypothetical protein
MLPGLISNLRPGLTSDLWLGLWVPEVGGGAGPVLLVATHLHHTHQGDQKSGQGGIFYCFISLTLIWAAI